MVCVIIQKSTTACIMRYQDTQKSTDAIIDITREGRKFEASLAILLYHRIQQLTLQKS